MAKQLQKLELTWIGKGEEPKLEPRILIEDPTKSYGDPKSENMLIHGDNLLALKALEQNFTGEIKCVAIDPPYNTGAAFEYYDDNQEHSIWLNLMYQRVKIIHNLLSKSGSLWIVIDDKEFAYLKVMCDEIFGRDNFINAIAIRDSHPSGLKLTAKDKTIIKTKSYILGYRKSPLMRINPVYQKRYDWDTHYNTFMDEELTPRSLKEVLVSKGIISKETKIDENAIRIEKFRKFCFENRDKIFQSTKEMPDEPRNESLSNRGVVVKYLDANGILNYALNGRRLFPLSKSIQDVGIDGQVVEDFAKLLCDFWDDVDFNNTQNEGDVKFPASKKPEYLIGRLLTMFSNKGDIVLDSFLGSGTTAAVAHKMNRRWIGIELGEHAITHCLPRLKNVVKGSDLTGITESVNWKGGGGFKFYTLAPSLIQKDKYGNDIINPTYNATMLAAAMAKQEGFHYLPHESIYWKQGNSSEKDFIFTTTQFITVELIDRLAEEMQPNESLLICCKGYSAACKARHSNITIKKIPQLLFGRCEFGKDDYSFNIVNLPHDETNEVEVEDDSDTKVINTKK
jgi:adenine-specific DNA-methyltransferase